MLPISEKKLTAFSIKTAQRIKYGRKSLIQNDQLDNDNLYTTNSSQDINLNKKQIARVKKRIYVLVIRRLAMIGAIIGGFAGGVPGAVIGGAIGLVIGAIWVLGNSKRQKGKEGKR